MNDRATLGGVPVRDLVAEFGTPLYVYDEAVLRRQCTALRAFCERLGLTPLYACKANPRLAVLDVVRDEGIGVDVTSPGELAAARRAGFAPEAITFHGNNLRDDELSCALEAGVEVTVDSLSQLERLGRLAPDGTTVGIRVNLSEGSGHHPHVVTAGDESKFGIARADLPLARSAASRHDLVIVGLHQHIGSGIAEAEAFLAAMQDVIDAASDFSDLRFVNFGGGLSVPYRPHELPMDLEDLAWHADPVLATARAGALKDIETRIEPGRYLVAECGVLLTTVTAIKRERRTTFAGTDTGFNQMMRPALYDAWHAIDNLTAADGAEVERYTVVGNICESTDVLGRDRAIPRIAEGDVLAIRNAGAYGACMAMEFNGRPLPAEVMVSGGSARQVRRRRTVDDLLAEETDGGPSR